MANVLEMARSGNAQENNPPPLWFVLHGALDAQRRRWGPDMQDLGEQLARYGWIVTREGNEVIAQHPSRLQVSR